MDIHVGDVVEVPGGMHGTVKFVGSVDGKKGVFAGVQLASEYAVRGKNSGEVDGKSYFKTTKPGSGIFLPLEKAIRKTTPSTPAATPSQTNYTQNGRTPLATLHKPNFSQSVGVGPRVASPALKPPNRRPSLPRPQSPLRKTPALARPATSTLTTPKTRPSVSLSKSQIVGGPQYRGSPTTRQPSQFGSSLRGPSGTTPNSRQLGPETLFDEGDEESTPTPTPAPALRTIDQTVQDQEIKRLKVKLEEKDAQLKEQASSLSEMETSLTELQSLLPDGDSLRKQKLDQESESDEVDQLRAMLREKNERIKALTAEFDTNRADFRSTIDTLELASTETERVYEKRVDDLLQEIAEMRDRSEDVASIAQQLKQLEELVAELEESLEDARRGEAEARAEVEFLRGEVERGRSELKREKERAGASGRDVAEDGSVKRASLRDLAQKDDEIRGLKAIIQSLNRDPMISNLGALTNGHSNPLPEERLTALERQIQELESALDQKTYREGELEREIQALRNARPTNIQGGHKRSSTNKSNRLSDGTVIAGEYRDQTIPPPPALETMHEADSHSTVTDSSALWCEICETGGHDILTCTNMFGHNASQNPGTPSSQRTGRDVVVEGLKGMKQTRTSNDIPRAVPLNINKSPIGASTSKGLPPVPPSQPVPNERGMVAGKESGVIDETKWCALCERDGHESVDCPYEDAF